MSGKTCKTCKWWTGDWSKEWCINAQNYIQLNRRICKCPKIAHESEEREIPDDGAEACDSSGYWAALCPGPEFGCIHHERKVEE